MALTFPRWIAGVVIGCLVAAAFALTPPRPSKRPPPGPREMFVRRDSRLDGAFTEAASRLRTLQLRDSVTAVLARLPRTDTSRVLVSPELPAMQRRLAGAVAARIEALRVLPADGRMDVVFISDTGATVAGRFVGGSALRATHLLPDSSRGCVSLARMRPFQTDSWWRSRVAGEGSTIDLVGACSFYEAHGAPGPAIDRWLRAGAWRYGLAGAWQRRQLPPGFFYEYQRPLLSRWFADELELRRYTTSSGYRCASGDASRCRSSVLDGPADSQSRRYVRVSAEGFIIRRWYEWYAPFPLGPAEPRLLGDMALALGPERFRAFWTSTLPPAEAFAAAAGQDIGAWTAGWARRTYGPVGRGPGMSAAGAAYATLISLLALSGAIAAARRRQVA